VSKTYDGAVFTDFGVGYVGFVSGEGPADLTGSLAFTGAAVSAINAGSYVVTPGGLTSSNYAITFVNGALTIDQAPLTVTADDQSRVYGVANPELTYTLSGFVNGEDAVAADVTGEPTLGTGAGPESLPDDYVITVGVGTLSALNYAFMSVVDGTLTVSKRSVTFDISNKGDAESPVLTYSSAPLPLIVRVVDVEGNEVAPVPASEPIAYDVDAPRYRIDNLGNTLSPALARPDIIDAGMYWVTIRPALGIDDARYDVSTAWNIPVFVDQRALSITSASAMKVYGAVDPVLAPVAVDGLVLAAHDRFRAGLELARVAGENVGSYELLLGDVAVESTDALRGVGNDVTANYKFSLGQFEITPAPLMIMAGGEEKVYGDTLSDGAGYTRFGASGLQFDDAVDAVSVAYEGGYAADASVGLYEEAIVLSGATGARFMASNYAISYVAGDLEVTPRSLTIAASGEEKVYGDTLSDGAGYTRFTTSGLQNGETVGSVSVAYAAGNGAGAPVATYGDAIGIASATGGTFTASNYAISYVSGDLEVTPRPLTITATDQEKEYDRVLAGGAGYTLVTTSGLQNGETVGSVSVSYTGGVELAAASSGSTGSIVIASAAGGTFTPSNYVITYASGTLTVIQRPITFDVANYDFLAGDVRVFMRDGLSPIGYSISSDPAGVNAYIVSYRRTHAADGTAVPLAQQPVSTIQQPGTYRVTIRVDDPNYVDAVLGGSVRTVWVNDATHVAFTDASDDGALVGGVGSLTLELRGADGLRRAGPAPTTVTVTSDSPTKVSLSSSLAGSYAASAAVTIAAFESTTELFARAVELAGSATELRASVDAPFTTLNGDSAAFTTRADLIITFGSGWEPDGQVGSDALSGIINVSLRGAGDTVVVAPSALRVDLSAEPELTYRDEAGTLLEPANVDIATGSSSASFRVVPSDSNIGTTTLSVRHVPGLEGVTDAVRSLTVTPRPTIASLNPTSLVQGTTGTITVTGTGFQAGDWLPNQVNLGDSGIVIDSIIRESATELTLTVSATSSAATGLRSLTVTNADGGNVTATDAFTVLPGINVINVNQFGAGYPDQWVYVTVVGSGLLNASFTSDAWAIVEALPAGLSDTFWAAHVKTAQGARGRYPITVTNQAGASITTSGLLTARQVEVIEQGDGANPGTDWTRVATVTLGAGAHRVDIEGSNTPYGTWTLPDPDLQLRTTAGSIIATSVGGTGVGNNESLGVSGGQTIEVWVRGFVNGNGTFRWTVAKE